MTSGTDLDETKGVVADETTGVLSEATGVVVDDERGVVTDEATGVVTEVPGVVAGLVTGVTVVPAVMEKFPFGILYVVLNGGDDSGTDEIGIDTKGLVMIDDVFGGLIGGPQSKLTL